LEGGIGIGAVVGTAASPRDGGGRIDAQSNAQPYPSRYVQVK